MSYLARMTTTERYNLKNVHGDNRWMVRARVDGVDVEAVTVRARIACGLSGERVEAIFVRGLSFGTPAPRAIGVSAVYLTGVIHGRTFQNHRHLQRRRLSVLPYSAKASTSERKGPVSSPSCVDGKQTRPIIGTVGSGPSHRRRQNSRLPNQSRSTPERRSFTTTRQAGCGHSGGMRLVWHRVSLEAPSVSTAGEASTTGNPLLRDVCCTGGSPPQTIASPTPRSLRMVAAPHGEPLGRTPRLARWPAARDSFQARIGSSLDDSVAKLANAYGSHSADVVGKTTLPSPVLHSGLSATPAGYSGLPRTTNRLELRPNGKQPVAGSSPAGVIEFSSLLALPFSSPCRESSVGPFCFTRQRERKPGI